MHGACVADGTAWAMRIRAALPWVGSHDGMACDGVEAHPAPYVATTSSTAAVRARPSIRVPLTAGSP